MLSYFYKPRGEIHSELLILFISLLSSIFKVREAGCWVGETPQQVKYLVHMWTMGPQHHTSVWWAWQSVTPPLWKRSLGIPEQAGQLVLSQQAPCSSERPWLSIQGVEPLMPTYVLHTCTSTHIQCTMWATYAHTCTSVYLLHTYAHTYTVWHTCMCIHYTHTHVLAHICTHMMVFLGSRESEDTSALPKLMQGAQCQGFHSASRSLT